MNEPKNKDGERFKVNGQWIKYYMGYNSDPGLICEIDLEEAW